MNQMMTNTPLRDAIYAMSLAKPIPDVELVEEFVRRYPVYAEELTDFAIDLAIDAIQHGVEDFDVVADTDTVSPAVARVMSKFQNGLYERSRARSESPRAHAARPVRTIAFPVANPFAELDRDQFRSLARKLDINTVFLSKLRDRHIEPASIPRRFRDLIADEMGEEMEILEAHLCAPPESHSARQFYKAEGKPTSVGQQSFQDAVGASGLNEAQKRRLISFRD